MILRIVGIMALGMSLAVSAHAGRGINRATGQAIWDAAVNGRTTTIGGGNNSMQVIRPTTTGTPVRASGGGVSVTDAGLPIPVGGAQVPVSVTTNIPKAEIAGAVVGCATGGIPGCALSAIPLAIAWMNLSGARVSPENPQQLEMMDRTVCTVAPCTEYLGNPNVGWVSTPAQACTGDYWAGPGNYRQNNWRLNGQTNGLWNCQFDMYNPNGTPAGFTGGASVQTRSVPPKSPTWYPSTPQAVKDALYNNDPPPPIVDELSRYGNIIWPGPASVTGPAEIKGPKTISNSTSGNQSSQTTTQASTPLTYNGSSVTAGNPTTSSTTTTTTTNPDGSTSTSTSTSTTTTEPGDTPQTPTEEGSPTDSGLPPVPSLYTRVYPNGMEGIWGEYKDKLKGTSLVSLVGKLMPNVGNGGSCPSWMLNLDLSQWATFGTHDVAPPCWIWDVAKAILVLSALLLARALIFGG